MGLTKLVIRCARQHNLKNISVEIPRNSLTLITGLAGSILQCDISQYDERIRILAQIVRGRKGAFRKELEKYAQEGSVRIRINDELSRRDDLQAIDKRKNHTIANPIRRLLFKQKIAA